MDTLAELQRLGLTLPTPAYLVGVLLFGIAGMVAWYRGRKRKLPRLRWLGLALMLYPYVVYETVWLYAIGTALCAGAAACWRPADS